MFRLPWSKCLHTHTAKESGSLIKSGGADTMRQQPLGKLLFIHDTMGRRIPVRAGWLCHSRNQIWIWTCDFCDRNLRMWQQWRHSGRTIATAGGSRWISTRSCCACGTGGWTFSLAIAGSQTRKTKKFPKQEKSNCWHLRNFALKWLLFKKSFICSQVALLYFTLFTFYHTSLTPAEDVCWQKMASTFYGTQPTKPRTATEWPAAVHHVIV